jgi:hypothetical protein
LFLNIVLRKWNIDIKSYTLTSSSSSVRASQPDEASSEAGCRKLLILLLNLNFTPELISSTLPDSPEGIPMEEPVTC